MFKFVILIILFYYYLIIQLLIILFSIYNTTKMTKFVYVHIVHVA